MASYGTAYTPLVVEQVQDLKNEVRSTRRTLLMGVTACIMFSCMIFALCVTAMEQSKDVIVVNSVLTDRATNAPVATRRHEEMIENPLSASAAAGVEWITMYHSDGGIARYQVDGFHKSSCSPESDDQCLKSGEKFIFSTKQGDFAGHPSVDNMGNAYLTFTPVTDEKPIIHGRETLAKSFASGPGSVASEKPCGWSCHNGDGESP